jgi:two-component system chemotaxis response regulator CheB
MAALQPEKQHLALCGSRPDMSEPEIVQTRLTHDLIVVGTSAGGLQALQSLLRGLPAALRAAVLVVQHVGASSLLAEILARSGELPVKAAKSGEDINPGQVYVAVPGMHLLVHDRHLLLRRGPRENLARPAIDPLFRSAACSHGARVIGVILSGALNDGTAGLRAIKRCGGIAVVQDPADAPFPDMPESALRHVDVDYCVPVSEMGALLARLAAEPAAKTPEIPMDIRLETAIAAQELSSMDTEDYLGKPAPFTCPECHGSLWEITDGSIVRYRCHVGHAYTGETMLAAQADDIEKMLWSVMRSHRERAELARRLAEREGSNRLAAQFRKRGQEYEEDAEIVHKLIQSRNVSTVPDSTGDDAD